MAYLCVRHLISCGKKGKLIVCRPDWKFPIYCLQVGMYLKNVIQKLNSALLMVMIWPENEGRDEGLKPMFLKAGLS